MKKARTDPFSGRIREILMSSSPDKKNGNFREMIVAEVRSYSREVQNVEAMSQLFIRLCDLIVDCQSAGMPDESFRLLVAHLLYESGTSEVPIDRELKTLTGMDMSSIRAAREHLKDECVESILLNRVGGGRKKGALVGTERAVNDHV